MNSLEKLVLMVNQIATNLATEPDPASATAEHIRLFWDPRMKDMIREYDGDGLSIVAVDAISQIST